jgi:DNA-directed RNA polymerase subunit RPC12/RpoP
MPTRVCHIFNGYFATASGGTQYYTNAGASARNYDIPTDSTLYATWTPNHKIKSTYETDANQHWKICSVCSIIMVNKENHSWNGGVITTSPTCTATGIRTYTCTVCGRTRTETVAALGHSPKSSYQNNASQHWKICSRCSAITTAKANHNWNGGTVTSSATCTSAGNRKYTCKTCGRTKNESIAALGHNNNGGVLVRQATCTTGGLIVYSCTRCGAELGSTTTGALGHAWRLYMITSGGTEHHYICGRCGNYKTEYTEP